MSLDFIGKYNNWDRVDPVSMFYIVLITLIIQLFIFYILDHVNISPMGIYGLSIKILQTITIALRINIYVVHYVNCEFPL